MNVHTLNGLQLMKMMASGEIPAPNIAELIPMLDGEANRGKMNLRVRADERHYNPQEIVHGGFAATVLDTTMACAIQTLLGPGCGLCTIDLDIKYFKAIPTNKDLFAKGSVSEVTRQIGFARGELVDQAGNIYAASSTSCMLLDK